jgi:hypothetical protein
MPAARESRPRNLGLDRIQSCEERPLKGANFLNTIFRSLRIDRRGYPAITVTEWSLLVTGLALAACIHERCDPCRRLV